jgi:hypothetical protein
MNSIVEFFQYILNSEELIRTGGLLVITFIVFAENGLFFAFFLPGDYLVFLAGVFCGTGILDVPIVDTPFMHVHRGSFRLVSRVHFWEILWRYV